MIMKRHRNQRGPTDAGWLKSMHSFSFGHYHDPNHMGFGPLRVINEDHVIPGAGFGTHPHANMEIISYVLGGKLAHKDDMGNGSTIQPNEIQLMSAGTGVTHSEFNASDEKEVHFLQIWIMPNVQNTKPGYQQKTFAASEMKNAFRLVVSPNGEDDSLIIQQDARMFTGKFDADAKTVFNADKQRKYWVQIAQGIAEVNGISARAGDGFAIADEDKIMIQSQTQTEILLFDLPQ
ncbi:Pirin [hydrothermal vent metagenome]|uniref:Pirin n=1 Tax=hydrothermal vent metagenome TaxID=652676 RepID=A0A3B0S816_9ZZZZ